MENITLALMSGIDIPLKDIPLVVHQPTVKEISYLGETEYFSAISCIIADKKILENQDNLDLLKINNFQIFMTIMTEEKTKDKKEWVKTFLEMVFPKYKINILPRSLLFSFDENTMITVDENNFELFQNCMKQIFLLNKNNENNELEYNPVNEKAREIAEKLKAGRRKIAELKSAQEGQGGILAKYISILTIGSNSMSLQDCLDLTPFQVFDLVERLNLKTAWDMNLKAKMFGGGNDKVENWMKSIH